MGITLCHRVRDDLVVVDAAGNGEGRSLGGFVPDRECLVGIAIALVLSRLLQSLLFGVGAHDPLTLATVTALLALVALAATLIPARNAMYVDPAVALRVE